MTTQALPGVSVVIPVLNGAATIGDTLQALVTQSPVPSSYEMIVVDNGSVDDTREIVARFSTVKLLSASRRGPAAARNVGMKAARNQIILHCDADTQPTRRWVFELASVFRDESVHIAAGKTLSFPPVTPAEHYLATAQLYDAEFNINRPVLPFVASMNMGVRRESAIAAGGWNEEMMTSEDVDFSTRILKAFGGVIRYAPGAVLFHRNRTSDNALRKQAWTYGEGVADTYRRYPEAVTWGMKQYLHLAPSIIGRSISAIWLRAAHRMGFATESEARYAHYHRMWTWWFWAGFFSFQKHSSYRPALRDGT